MGFRIIYKTLFEIKILHHYFLDNGENRYDLLSTEEKNKIEEYYDIRKILEIIPTSDCTQILQSHRCIFKATADGFSIGVKASQDAIQPDLFNPFIPISQNTVFRFLVRMKDPGFLNYTALPLNAGDGRIFIFKNYSFNTPAKFPSLSAIPPLYVPATTYYPGDMLADHPVNPAKLFTALVRTTHLTSTASDWLTEEGDATTPLSYANINDSQMVVNGILSYTMKIQDARPAALLKNSAGNEVSPKTEIIPGDHYSLQADLRSYPDGFYTLHVESPDAAYSDDLTFYLVQNSETPFGLIEVKAKSDLAGYDLLDEGHFLSPVYELRFRNRRTHWRYTGKYFETPYIVPDPLPLTFNGHIEIIKPAEPEDTKTIMLPNPSDPVIRPEALIKDDETKYYSDIHIN